MINHLSHTFLNAVLRLAGVPHESRPQLRVPPPPPTPDHIMRRLEDVFEALAALSSQPNVEAALDLACDTLQAELPTAAVVAGLYDIDADEIRIVSARGVEHDLLRYTSMPRNRCLVGRSAEEIVVARGGERGVDWLGTDGDDSTVLLCPILHDSHLLGVLGLADPLCTAGFSWHDRDLVGYVARQLANVIQAQRHRPRRHGSSPRLSTPPPSR